MIRNSYRSIAFPKAYITIIIFVVKQTQSSQNHMSNNNKQGIACAGVSCLDLFLLNTSPLPTPESYVVIILCYPRW
jgi:hypothetical protein